jgi:outer membrane protein assembly factor BamB
MGSMVGQPERGRRGVPAPAFLLAAALVSFLAPGQRLRAADWPQWGRTPQHGGSVPVLAQPLEAILADIVYDPFVEAEKEEVGGALLAHYAVPLVDDSGVYMTFKTGEYTGFGSWDTLTWNVKKLVWVGATLREAWSFQSDWKPEPLSLTGWEAVFLPALSGDWIYVPGLGGTVFRVSKATGIADARIDPFGEIDPSRYVAGGLAAAPDGSIVYDAIGLSAPDPLADVVGAWLVRIGPGATSSIADFGSLVPGAPAASDPCRGAFAMSQRPWPPSPTAVPPSSPCGSQRPGINVVPAIGPDGTIYTVSRAHGNDRYSYLVAAHADLTPAWNVSLRGLLHDGCGVLLPIDDSNLGCRTGATAGIDPATNEAPAGRVSDRGTSSPVVLPDGAVLIGTYSSYNFSRGHLFKFSGSGEPLASYDFGWDITPAVYAHDGTYSIVLKDNQYFTADGEAYYDVSSLDADLAAEWSFRSTNTESCARQPDGTIVCLDDHPDGFEWCVNQPAIDADGVVYLNSEDGVLYAIDRSGRAVGSIFLDTALGAAYTPLSIGPDGVVYSQNNGRLFAVGKARASREPPETLPARSSTPRLVERP